MSLPIAITCGDPAGVGPEIIADWLRQNSYQQDAVCLIGPQSWLSGCEHKHAKVVGSADFVATPGEPTVAGAEIARDALEEAAYGCRQGRYSAVVTAPISKAWMQQAGFAYPGHTEFFADRWFGEPSMAFAGGKMRVVLATWHIPLSEVPNHMNQETIERAVKNASFLAERLGAVSPRIGVCGLNPHAGEGGLLGFEEQGVIDPILDDLRGIYHGLSKCLPSDTLFWRHLQGDFDVVVALYHDQGLGPLKTVDFESAANLTLGLPFVRTSPDHGTAFDIAGKGIAKTTSFSNAVALAKRLSLSM
ncbi:4-hydroxythreonine-4-phosphate dehydrogenase PdxA [Rubellicoccus peritrichatus]|uniref:4-hydroxythreonine-4-phosphate dehydrogenase PdxA n=1 Tax=Rubellicoccus peritrichatus TaxID=3080537 RepID=A0AAQ3LFA5_9BACT|nr:4-hydroxythreonine-4-phosphate dehydrogenase PdxA [Puniceicoccus sp. CR14]WOO42658.1 4-hydroxythreonine-4-phosphate dehydrogenase PdxA [Puniceicoccus sp. CR14]